MGFQKESSRRSTFLRILSAAILLILVSACSTGELASTGLPDTPVISGENTGYLTADEIASLRSLEKVDDYPFYVMHYYGGYSHPKAGIRLPEGADIVCSLFAALGKPGDMLYGRNFDWEFSPSLLLFTDPPDGYASASMVDLTFLGIDPQGSEALVDARLLERSALLSAASMPFDGMNEHGLTIGMAAVPEEFMDDASFDASKPTIGSIGIIRQVLDHARYVDEAVSIFEQYNIDFHGGPPIHYLIADRSGRAVLVEFYQGKMVALPNEVPWHAATNHMRCLAEGDGGCWRYRTLSGQLSSLNGRLEPQTAMQLLSDVRQDGTQWSAVYDMTSGEIQVAIAGRYGAVYSFYLDMVEP